MTRKIISVVLALTVCFSLTSCGSNTAATSGSNTLTVFNYSQYIDPEILEQFTKETGIKIKYEEATTPEELYTKYTAGAISYDLLCSSDYMIQRLIAEGQAQPIDFDSMTYYSNINPSFRSLTEAFDPDNKYSLPYFWGTVGILYNTKLVDSPVDSWGDLFNGKYKGQIIMQDSMRDSFMVALKYLGYSLNTTDEAQIREAADLLKAQKPDVESYLVDEARDEVVAENAIMAVIYSGEAYLGKQYNENLTYVIPKEGSNMWIDSWIITKNCQNKEAAEKFLDFLCREDIAKANFEYVYYSSPNDAVVNSMDDELRSNIAVVPTTEAINNCEVYKALDNSTTELYNELWKEIKSE